MREILFRGKRKSDGEWVFGMPWIFKDHACICPWKEGMCKYDTGFYPVPVDPKTVGQYIGKKDKNRKKIFEGDIVQAIKIEFNPPRKYRKPYQVLYNSDFPGAVEEYYSPFEHFTEKVEYEVIGNIYDNPELLEGA